MKKWILTIICLLLISCEYSGSKYLFETQEIVLPKGYKLINYIRTKDNWDSESYYMIEKADSNYIPKETLIINNKNEIIKRIKEQ